jgi:hypothetical protein
MLNFFKEFFGQLSFFEGVVVIAIFDLWFTFLEKLVQYIFNKIIKE